MHDAGIFNSSCLKSKIDNGFVLAGFHLIGDGAFPLSTTKLKPYPGSVLTAEQEYFNYRLSSARMHVENAFGRLKGRFKLLQKGPQTKFTTTVKIIMACCVLHNLCETKASSFNTTLLDEVVDNNNDLPQPSQPEYNWDEVNGMTK